MLETDSALMTWSIPPQCLGESFACSATRLPDHRKEYLDYEGEVSDNRGMVSRVDAGVYEQLSAETFTLRGTRFIGRMTVENGKMMFVCTR